MIAHLKEEREGFSEGLEVVDVVEARPDLDVLEEGHPEDGEDEHDEEEKQRDIDESRECHDEREEQGSNPLGAFDQTKHSPNLCHSHLNNNICWLIALFHLSVAITLNYIL